MKTLFILLFLVLLFSNSSAQWESQVSGTTENLFSISPANNGGAYVWACGENGTVLRSNNMGESWTSVGGGVLSSLPLYNICGLSYNSAVVTGSNVTGGYVYKTTNGGGNWTQVFFQAGGFINAIHIYSPDQLGYMQGDPIGGRWSLWKTTDAGNTWDSAGMYLPQAGSEAGWNNSLYAVSYGTFHFGTNNSRIYKTVDGGTTWTFSTTPDVNSYSISLSTDPLGVLGISGGTQLLRTTNSGMNWTAYTGPGTGNIIGSTSAVTAFWYTRGGGIYSSLNEGFTWATDTVVPGAQFNDMGSMVTIVTENGIGDHRVWAVGNTGRIFVRDVLLLSISTISSATPEKYSLSQNYPNPFNPSTNINFDIVKNGFVSVKVYNSLGQQVGDLVNREMTAGSYQADFNAAELTSGIYFYTITAGDFVQTKKMMLVK